MATILIVDDEQDARDAMRELLELEGHEVRVSGDGADALVQAANLHPDLIVMDLAMPRLDGLNATRLLRRGRDTSAARVLLVSAHCREDEWPRLRRMGFDAMLQKPVRGRDLVTEIERLLALPRADGASTRGHLRDPLEQE